ncbi:MAG: 50S ribosomal protein L15 [bacterium]|nr:50S ribosomal protein L15 [bacterium]
MQLHQLKPKHKSKKRKRVGRGGKRGTYSGRGMKGQKSRAGRRLQPVVRELIKRYPKLRGYRHKTKNQALGLEPQVVNLSLLEKKFEADEKVNPESLLEKGLIRRIRGRTPQVKILGGGEITKPLTVEKCQVSKPAKEKIEKIGGTIKISN